MEINLLSEIAFLCGAMLVVIGLYAWIQRTVSSARLFSLFSFAQSIYVLGYSMELSSQNLPAALFWSKVEYIGILTFPTLYLLFTIQYIGREKWLSRRNLILLFTLPLAILIIKFFDDNLHLIYSTAWLEQSGSIWLLSFTRGPVYLLQVIYNLIILTLANGLLWQKRRFSSSLYRNQTSIILASALLLYIFYIFYLSGITIVPSLKLLDINPFVFTIWIFAIAWAIFRHHLFDLAPIARETLIETLNDGVIVLDEQYRVVDVNPAAQRIFNWERPPLGELAVRLLQKWDYQTAPSHIIENSILNRAGTRELRHETQEKSLYYEVTISNLENKQNKIVGRLMIMHDITARKMASAKLLELSLVDELTGLNNRRGFNLLATQMIQMALRMKLFAVLIYSDLDELKWINDNLGHAIGDQVLVETANLFKNVLRSSDIIARLGGDEFVVLALESQDYTEETILKRLEEQLKNRNALKSRRYQLSLSFGYALFEPENPCSVEELLEMADKAMYEQKQSKKQAKTNSPKNQTSTRYDY